MSGASPPLRLEASLCRPDDGAPLGRAPLAVDWVPLHEAALWDGVRLGRLEAVLGAEARTVEPRWHPDDGPPRLAGVRVAVRAGGAEAALEVPAAYFRPEVEAATPALVEAGKLRGGELFAYTLAAAAADESPAPGSGGEGRRLRTRPRPRPLPVEPGEAPAPAARREGLAARDGETPVLVAPDVLEQTLELTRSAPDREVGGALVGRLRRAPRGEGGGLFLEVTAQLPAAHTTSDLTRLTFTPETWAQVERDLAARLDAGREVLAGWWHSHPFVLRPSEEERDSSAEASPARPAEPPPSSAFLSPEDRLLHRAVFSRAWCVALVVGAREGGALDHALYGWHGGRLVRRGYDVLLPAVPVAATA